LFSLVFKAEFLDLWINELF